MTLPNIVDSELVTNAILPSTVDNLILQNAIDAGNGQIVAITNKSDWNPDEAIYQAVQNIGNLFAIWWIIRGWDDKMYGELKKQTYQAYRDSITDFKDSTFKDIDANPDFDIVTTPEVIPSLDNNVEPYLSDWYH